jgi:hypothetical protein
MNSPLTDESRGITTIDASDLTRKLQSAKFERDDATPEPSFDIQNGAEQNRYLCKMLRQHFKPAEAETIRQAIGDFRYWRCEALHWQAKIDEFLHANEETKNWRTLAEANKNVCLSLGFTQDAIDQHRLQIVEPHYWEAEEECLTRASLIREDKLREQWRQQDELRELKELKELKEQMAAQAKRPQSKPASTRKRSNVGQARRTRRSTTHTKRQ